MFIIISINAQKAFDKFQYPLLIKQKIKSWSTINDSSLTSRGNDAYHYYLKPERKSIKYNKIE